jgi:PIN domain nuclease of toxin-antitoxin system
LIVLDTHAWIWWTGSPGRLSARARAAVEAADALGVSAISVWELATLVAKKRLELDRDVLAWARQALALPRVSLLPLTPEIAVASCTLPAAFPGDPADRIIVATARESAAAVVSRDARFRELPELKTIW